MTKSPLAIIEDGLRFECTGCGKCCSGGEGYVWVTPEDVESMAAELKLSVPDFSEKYLRRIGQRYSLKEIPTGKPNDFDCVFLENKKLCRVYLARPVQCRTFPFWPANIESAESWKETLLECEGINDSAPLVGPEEVQRQLAKQEEAIADSYHHPEA